MVLGIQRTVQILSKCFFCVGLSLLVGCGGGGGGGGNGFIGAANVAIDVSPGSIDTADRAMVRIRVSEVNQDGIALKVRFPVGLEYVSNSAVLAVDGQEIDSSPDVNQTSEKSVYLVFYLSQGIFSENSFSGDLTFQLQGTKGIEDGLIEVDADVDDPKIGNASEFNIETPAFEAQDQSSIVVND